MSRSVVTRSVAAAARRRATAGRPARSLPPIGATCGARSRSARAERSWRCDTKTTPCTNAMSSILGRAYQLGAAPALDARVGPEAAGMRGAGGKVGERPGGGSRRPSVVELAPAHDAPVRPQSARMEVAGHDAGEAL